MTMTVYSAVLDMAAPLPTVLAALTASCDAGERARAERFVFKKDRLAHLAARGLLRHTLSTLCPLRKPEDWRFTLGALGKPHLEMATDLPDIRFNLSHCPSRIVCVVTEAVDCGIDVEPVTRILSDDDTLRKSCLTPEEDRWVAGQPKDKRSLAFLKLWTMKEAVSKAVGLGLHLPFQQLSLAPGAPPAVRSIPGYAAGRFWVHQTIGADHVEAIAVLRPPGERFRIVPRLLPIPVSSKPESIAANSHAHGQC